MLIPKNLFYLLNFKCVVANVSQIKLKQTKKQNRNSKTLFLFSVTFFALKDFLNLPTNRMLNDLIKKTI